MIVFIITNVAIAIVVTALGVMALLSKPKNAVYQSFFVFTSGVALSAVVKPFFWEAKNIFALLLVRWGFEMIVLGAFLLVHVPPSGRLSKRFFWPIIPWFVLFLSAPSLLIVASLRADPVAFFWRIYNDTFPLFTGIMVAYLVVSFFFCLRRRVDNFGLPSSLARGLILIVASSASVMCIADLVLPVFGVYRFAAGSNFFAMIILVIGGYSIVRYGAGNGSAILRRGIPYFLSLVSVAVLFFGIEFTVEKFFYRNDEVVDVAAAVVGALAFSPLRDLFNKITDRIFFRNSYHFFTAIRELGERFGVSIDRNALLATTDEFLRMTVRPTETVFFAVNEGETEATLIFGLDAKSIMIADYDSLAVLFLKRAHERMIITDTTRLFHMNHIAKKEDACELIKERAARLGIAAIVPVMVREKTKMIMMVGHKCSGALLNKDDSEFLGFIARRTAITLENIDLRASMERQAEKFEERVTARTERLKNMYESQSKFLADVSHEFKTPLAILKMHAGIFAASEDAEQKKAWYVMDTTLDRLSRMVGNVLDVTKICSSQGGLCKKCILVDDLLRETHDDCVILAEDKGVALYFFNSHMSILGEWDRLKEVMLNLLSNALHHTPAGGSITLAARELDGEAEITVKDTGSGIPRDHLPHIFERFYRIGESDFAGTGIGLYLCRQIIEGHGGTITAESNIGEGSCFIVRLPLFTDAP